jgi:hypothetical protein
VTTPKIFFHIGLGKVASTYLQNRVFPALENIYYLPRDRFRRHPKIVASGKYPSILLSRESGLYLYEKLDDFKKIYPDAYILLFFRRQDEWIASHYRRYVKNGGLLCFEEYLDLENDSGIWKQQNLIYMDAIEKTRNLFGERLLVLTYDRLKNDQQDFVQRIADFTGATFDYQNISLKPVHSSHSEKKLKAARKISKLLGLTDPESSAAHRPFHRLRRRLELLRSHLILMVGSLLPERWAETETLTSTEQKDKIRSFYASDWQDLVEYEQQQFK